MISIVIPVYNEEKILEMNASFFGRLSKQSELLFVDGGSIDRTVELAARYVNVLHCKKGRAKQMNYGAEHARNDILLFMHADNCISGEALENIENNIHSTGAVGGCLTQRIDKKGLIYRLIEMQGNIRARRSRIFYGDQGIFVRKDVFNRLGGFPDVPVFEDVLFSKKVKCIGKTPVLSDKILVSSRRWEKQGIVKTTIMFNILIAMFKLGFPLEKIKALYEDLR
jgi:rSAM/selenodomain-associated transferase 2